MQDSNTKNKPLPESTEEAKELWDTPELVELDLVGSTLTANPFPTETNAAGQPIGPATS